MSLREDVREWLIDKHVGLIDSAELMRRADQKIAELDAPPDFLLTVSLGEPLAHVERLDLVKERLTREDLAKLAGRMLARLKAGDLDLETVAAAATKISFPRDEAMIDPWLEFDDISDRRHQIEWGLAGPEDFRSHVIAALERAASCGTKGTTSP